MIAAKLPLTTHFLHDNDSLWSERETLLQQELKVNDDTMVFGAIANAANIGKAE